MKQAYGKPIKFKTKTKKLIQSIDELMTSYSKNGMKITVRQVYYQLVARNIIENSKKHYDRISEIVSAGRMTGLLDWDCIEDRTRFSRQNAHWDSPKEIISAAAAQYAIDKRETQPYYVECWIEKDSLISILEKICKHLDVPCFSCRGFPSITALHDAAERFRSQDRESVILYAGDHDPSGLKIPKTITETLTAFGVDVEMRRIGLTIEQIDLLGLPPFPAKEQDKNYAEYVKTTGLTQAWELDALPPEKLSEIFENEISKLTDFEAYKGMCKIEKEDKAYFDSLIA